MQKEVCRIGYWAGLLAFASAVAYVIVQLLQVLGVLRFPADEKWIYATSLCIVVPFVLAILALHYVTAPEKKFWSHAALVFITLYAVFVTANYVVQLATVIPAKINGTMANIRVLEQTPHSLFWDFDALGYILMGLAMLMALPVFEKKEKWVRGFFIANAAMTPVISVVYFYPTYSNTLLLLGFPWGVTAPGAMLMLALWFRRKGVKSKRYGLNESRTELIADLQVKTGANSY